MSTATQITLDDALAQSNRILEAIDAKTGSEFAHLADAFVLAFLRRQGPASGETITNACKEAGIVPADDRHFGPCFRRLSHAGDIVRGGFTMRTRGHGAPGIVWKAVTR